MSSLKSVKGIEFVFTLGILLVASTTIHEYGHLVTLRLLGGRGVIESNILTGVQMKQPCQYSYGNNIVAFMGGWSAGLIFLLLWVVSEDPEDKVARFSIAIYQLIYGTFEGVWFILGNDVFLLVGVLLGVGLMLLTMITALVRRKVVFKFITRQNSVNS